MKLYKTLLIAAIFALCGQLLAEEKLNAVPESEHPYKSAFDTFYNYIRILNAVTIGIGSMQGYEGRLTDKEIESVVHYVYESIN